MELRKYQIDTIEKARESIRSGNKRIIIQASCGAGKTIIAASIVSNALEKGKKIIFLVHFRQLAYQAMERFNDFGIGDEVGMIMSGEEPHYGRPVQIISIQTYARRLQIDNTENHQWFRDADIVIYDECFLGKTLIDGVKIKNLKVGDKVNSYNEKTGTIEKKRIINIFKTIPNSLCRVKIKNGAEVVCTETHPFYSKGKYLTANNLSCNTPLSCINKYQTIEEKEHESYDWGMWYLWGKGCLFWEKTLQNIIASLSSWTGLLFRRMFRREKKNTLCRGRGKVGQVQSGICLRKNEKKEPYGGQANHRKNDFNKACKWDIKCFFSATWWKRKPSAYSSANDGSSFGVGNGSACENNDWKYRFEKCCKGENSESLQDGCSKFKIENRNRNRRTKPQREKKDSRCKERYVLKAAGVDSVEIYKQTSNGRFGGMCEEGFVYNLEVEDNNNYFAEEILVHNCHASVAKTRKAILNLYRESAIIIGLTATPCRADSRPLGEIYEDIISCSNINELTELGYLVPVIYYGATRLPDLKNIPTVAGDYNKKVLGERVNKAKLVGDILENWLRIASERQTVIFATNVKHSKHIETVFSKYGINIEHIDAHTPQEERQDILNRFKNGDTQVVTNCAVFSEGADFPWASCVVLAKPSKSFSRFIQMAGRGLRPYPSKSDCILIDHAGLISRHGFLDDDVFWSLKGKEKAWRKAPKKKEKPPLTCKQCQNMFKGRICPRCGFEVKNYGKKIEAVEAELQEIKRGKKNHTYTMEEKLRFMRMAEYYRRSKGYQSGYASHLFRSKFGVWPNRFKDVSPLVPDSAFKNYITYKNIQYHKNRQKAA